MVLSIKELRQSRVLRPRTTTSILQGNSYAIDKDFEDEDSGVQSSKTDRGIYPSGNFPTTPESDSSSNYPLTKSLLTGLPAPPRRYQKCRVGKQRRILSQSSVGSTQTSAGNARTSKIPTYVKNAKNPKLIPLNHTSATKKELEKLESQICALRRDICNPLSLSRIEHLQRKYDVIQSTLPTNIETPPTLPAYYCDTRDNVTTSNYCPDCEDSSSSTSSTFIRFNDDDMDPSLYFNEFATEEETKVVPTRSPEIKTSSKRDLLRTVQTERRDHRKNMQKLQSEIKRLKVHDTMRTKEILFRDVTIYNKHLLGEGSFSSVFKGLYQGSEVAVKQLNVSIDEKDKPTFTAEVEMLRDLKHPRIVLLIGVCLNSFHRPMAILEYMSNGSLFSLTHDPEIISISGTEFTNIARDISLGMNHLHKNRPSPIMHLDLKSTNVLLTENNRAKIADFGFSLFSRTINKKKKRGINGSPSWMAPELFNGGITTTKTDVYSYSIILWEMVTGDIPYLNSSIFQIIDKVSRKIRPPMTSDERFCPNELRTLITRCWHHIASNRPSFSEILCKLETMNLSSDWSTIYKRKIPSVCIPPLRLDDIDSESKTLKSTNNKEAKNKLITESLTQELLDEMHFMYENNECSATATCSANVTNDNEFHIDVSPSALLTPRPPGGEAPCLSLVDSSSDSSDTQHQFIPKPPTNRKPISKPIPSVKPTPNMTRTKNASYLKRSEIVDKRRKLKPTKINETKKNNWEECEENSISKAISKAMTQRRKYIIDTCENSPVNSDWSILE